jgi:hypothetical protein
LGSEFSFNSIFLASIAESSGSFPTATHDWSGNSLRRFLDFVLLDWQVLMALPFIVQEIEDYLSEML